MSDKFISSKEVVKRYNVSYSSLNYYTNIGLFKVVRRSGNTRLYDEEEIRTKRAKIDKLINEGYPLRLICKMLNTS